MVIAGQAHPADDEKLYHEAESVWSFWKFDLMRATDGTGAVWLTIRLHDGKPYEGWNADDDEDEDLSQHWLCNCGNYIEDGLHCTRCGNEPPWGCDCSFCNERGWEDEDEYDETGWYDDPYVAQSIYEAIEADEEYEYDPSDGDETYDERSL